MLGVLGVMTDYELRYHFCPTFICRLRLRLRLAVLLPLIIMTKMKWGSRMSRWTLKSEESWLVTFLLYVYTGSRSTYLLNSGTYHMQYSTLKDHISSEASTAEVRSQAV